MIINDLTPDQIDTLSTAELRAWLVRANVSRYLRLTTMAIIPAGPEMIGVPGALTAVDVLVQAIQRAYQDRQPVIEHRGGQIEILVWQDDATLRDELRRRLDQALSKRAEAKS